MSITATSRPSTTRPPCRSGSVRRRDGIGGGLWSRAARRGPPPPLRPDPPLPPAPPPPRARAPPPPGAPPPRGPSARADRPHPKVPRHMSRRPIDSDSTHGAEASTGHRWIPAKVGAMRILILGGDGYLGWPTAMRFSARGHEVFIVDNFSRRRWHHEHSTDSLTPIASLGERVEAWREISGRNIQVMIGNIDDGEFLD